MRGKTIIKKMDKVNLISLRSKKMMKKCIMYLLAKYLQDKTIKKF